MSMPHNGFERDPKNASRGDVLKSRVGAVPAFFMRNVKNYMTRSRVFVNCPISDSLKTVSNTP